MAGWTEARAEAMFKPVEGGFIFRWGSLAPRYYLVTEAQKTEIQRIMRASIWSEIRRSDQKRIGQVLEGARHTEQRIAWRERNETFARILPMLGLFGTAVALALLFILVTFIFPRNTSLGTLALMFGLYFFYLVILKLRLARLPKRQRE